MPRRFFPFRSCAWRPGRAPGTRTCRSRIWRPASPFAPFEKPCAGWAPFFFVGWGGFSGLFVDGVVLFFCFVLCACVCVSFGFLKRALCVWRRQGMLTLLSNVCVLLQSGLDMVQLTMMDIFSSGQRVFAGLRKHLMCSRPRFETFEFHGLQGHVMFKQLEYMSNVIGPIT